MKMKIEDSQGHPWTLTYPGGEGWDPDVIAFIIRDVIKASAEGSDYVLERKTKDFILTISSAAKPTSHEGITAIVSSCSLESILALGRDVLTRYFSVELLSEESTYIYCICIMMADRL